MAEEYTFYDLQPSESTGGRELLRGYSQIADGLRYIWMGGVVTLITRGGFFLLALIVYFLHSTTGSAELRSSIMTPFWIIVSSGVYVFITLCTWIGFVKIYRGCAIFPASFYGRASAICALASSLLEWVVVLCPLGILWWSGSFAEMKTSAFLWIPLILLAGLNALLRLGLILLFPAFLQILAERIASYRTFPLLQVLRWIVMIQFLSPLWIWFLGIVLFFGIAFVGWIVFCLIVMNLYSDLSMFLENSPVVEEENPPLST